MASVVNALGLEGVQLQAGSGTAPADEALAGKFVALYFSAHWCPPCRGFTPVLAEVYQRLRQQGKEFEVVFVSADRSKSQFEEYFAQMPWLAVPFEDASLQRRLSERFGVQGIPRLVILGPDGAVVAHDARAAVMADRAGDGFPWAGAAGPTGLAALLSSPRGLLLLFMLLWWLSQWFTKRQS